MQRQIKLNLRQRILISAVCISIVTLASMAYLVNEKNKQRILLKFVSDIVYQIPSVINEVEQSKILPELDSWSNYYAPSSKDLSAVICDKQNKRLWTSAQSLLPGGDNSDFDICNHLPEKLKQPELYQTPKGTDFIAYETMRKNGQSDFRVIILKSASSEIKALKQTDRLILFSIVTLILIILLTLFFTIRWGLSPINRLVSEINQIQDHQQSIIEGSYPEELQSTVLAFNRLLHQANQQETRYKHAMSDLAHSMKTRIALSSLLLQQALPSSTKSDEIQSQFNEMDSMVQYQLRKATMGAKGLGKHKTSLTEKLDGFESIFTKLRHHLHSIQLQRRFEPEITLPIESEDLTEMLGNILENTYRYAKSKIVVSAKNIERGILISIKNDGPAIAPDIIEELFGRGKRADQINPGTGIGLSVCREIAQSYGGDIWFEAVESNEGVVLNIFLPHR